MRSKRKGLAVSLLAIAVAAGGGGWGGGGGGGGGGWERSPRISTTAS